MDGKTRCIAREQEGYEGFEQLVERGRQLHNQAVYELFAGMLSCAMLSLKKCCGILNRNRGIEAHSRKLYIKNPSRIPV